MPPTPATPRPMPFEKYAPYVPIVLRDRTWPNRTIDKAPALVLGRPARRQPGADRPDGPVRKRRMFDELRGDGLQRDRGRLPSRQPARLRLRPPAHRGGPHPGRRDHPGPRPVPRRADRAHLRVHRRRATGDRPLLQLDEPAAAAGRVRTRAGRHRRHRRERRPAVPQVGGAPSRFGDPLRVLPGELHADRARVRHRDLRAGDGHHRAGGRPADHPQPAGDGRVLLPQRLRRRHRVVPAHDQPPPAGRAVAAPPQRSRLRRCRCRVRRDGGRRPRRGHAVRQR